MASEEFIELSKKMHLLVSALKAAYVVMDDIDVRGYYESNDPKNKKYIKHISLRSQVDMIKEEKGT